MPHYDPKHFRLKVSKVTRQAATYLAQSFALFDPAVQYRASAPLHRLDPPAVKTIAVSTPTKDIRPRICFLLTSSRKY